MTTTPPMDSTAHTYARADYGEPEALLSIFQYRGVAALNEDAHSMLGLDTTFDGTVGNHKLLPVVTESEIKTNRVLSTICDRGAVS